MASTAREAGSLLLGTASLRAESSLSRALGGDHPPPSGLAPSRQRRPREQVRDVAAYPRSCRPPLAWQTAGLVQHPNLFPSRLFPNSPAWSRADQAGPASTGCFSGGFSGRWGQSPVSRVQCAQGASLVENLMMSLVPFTFMVKEWEPFCHVAGSLPASFCVSPNA